MYGTLQGIKCSVSHHAHVKELRRAAAYHYLTVYDIQHILSDFLVLMKTQRFPEPASGILYDLRVHGL